MLPRIIIAAAALLSLFVAGIFVYSDLYLTGDNALTPDEIKQVQNTAPEKTEKTPSTQEQKIDGAEEGSVTMREVFEPLTVPIVEEIPAYVTLSARNAIVNIICSREVRGGIKSITGSGVLIDERGVILTNAHIGQYFLLDDVFSCKIRTGSPAEDKYEAELLYIPPSWVYKNAEIISKSGEPRGTGEKDYALLFITDTLDGSRLPRNFAHLEPYTVTISEETINPDIYEGSLLHIIGYPSEFFESDRVLNDLFPLSSDSVVQNLYTFNNKATSTLDLISLGNTIVAQRGASGGAVVGADGTLKGLIVTTTENEAIQQRSLRAISLSYIDRDLRNTTAGGINYLLSGDLEDKTRDFERQIAPSLKRVLRDAIE